MSLRLGLGLLNALVSLGSFVGILWMLSGPLEISLGGHAIGIPGYMVWAALLYAIAGSFITHYVGRRLILLSNQQQRREADFRYGLMQLRENAEGVALSRGGARESDASSRRFEDVRLNWWALMRCTKRLQFFTVGFAQLAVIFPFWVAAPRYFSGAFSLGQLMQIGSAFDSVRTALSWFVTSYATLAEWKASVDRLLQFTDTLDRASRAQAGPQLHIRSAPGTLDLSAQSLSVRLPDGRPLLEDARLDLHRGDRVVLSGASGSGKSTLFRVMAGIWPFAEGCLELPAAGQMLFLPQKPYIPAGPLRQALAYPAHPEQFEDAALREVLAAVRLGDLADRLDEHKPWMQVLSPGEQQRLAIARALLQKPQWLFLDEATAALDADNEQRMYALLTERLPQTAMLSIAHREQINPFHRRAWTIKDGALDPRADPLPGKA
jgi:putative ATP-binding cassette transporter